MLNIPAEKDKTKKTLPQNSINLMICHKGHIWTDYHTVRVPLKHMQYNDNLM